jgi:hypothetical protein
MYDLIITKISSHYQINSTSEKVNFAKTIPN